MKTLFLTISILLFGFTLQAQEKNKEKTLVNIGVSYSPLIMFAPNISLMAESYMPKLDFQFGVKGFYIYAALGVISEFGFKGYNDFLIAGLSYSYNPFVQSKNGHWISFEFGYHTRKFLDNRFILEITAKHGVSIEDGLFLFSPLNIGLKYKLIK